MKLTVAAKMTLITTGLLAVIFAAMTMVNLALQERASTAIVQKNGVQLAETAAAVLRTAMLQNDREKIQETLDNFGAQRDIERIRIYNKQGLIAYSTRHAEIGAILDTTQAQCLVCHGRVVLPNSLPPDERAQTVVQDGRRMLAVTHALLNEPSCATAACHYHEQDGPLLGVMDVDLNLEPFEAARRAVARGTGLVGLVSILLAVIVVYLAGRQIVFRRVRTLIDQTRRLAAGDLTVRVAEGSQDEIGTLDRTFNQLALDLQNARNELLEWGRTLEQRVQAKADELVRAQDQMLQVEKMASLGKLAAVVAHEINNPLASVVTYAKTVVRRLKKQDELTDECKENLTYLEAISDEAARCGKIVSQLLAFARRGNEELAPMDVNATIENALFLVNHQLELNSVEAERRFAPDLPEIIADQNQVQQFLMALIINAAQAMPEGGKITLATARAPGGVTIEVADNGPGMEPEVARHAFEPFYTTKSEGSGVGLGLSVVYGIVKRHGGRIDLDTAPGEGCRFTIFLPEDAGAASERESS